MLKIVALIGFAILASGVHAGTYEEARDQAYADAWVIAGIRGDTSPCGFIGMSVSSVMVRRLNGTPMSEQMSEPDFEFYRFVIRDAYNQAFYQTTEYQLQLVRDFRERYERECYHILEMAG